MRRPVGVIAALAVVVFASLAARYAGEGSARWLDRRIQSLVGSSGPGRTLPDIVIALGNKPSVVVLALSLSGLALALGQRRLAVLAILGPGLTGLVTESSKPLVGRMIGDAFAYPSGHTGGATALGIVATLLLISLLRTTVRTSALLLTIGTALSGGTMAFALVSERDHYPTDTVGGFSAAVALVLLSALAIEWWAGRADRG